MKLYAAAAFCITSSRLMSFSPLKSSVGCKIILIWLFRHAVHSSVVEGVGLGTGDGVDWAARLSVRVRAAQHSKTASLNFNTDKAMVLF
jgi:hypothetical protein